VKNNIYGAPVYDQTKKELVGMIDMLDIVVFLVQLFESQHEQGTDFTSRDFYTLLDEASKFRTESAKSVADLSKRNTLIPVNHAAPIKEVLKIFATSHVHRVPILENPWTVGNILTQSDIIKWLANEIKLDNQEHGIGLIGKHKIGDMFPRKEQIFSVKGDDIAIEAFKLMAHHRISSVAVVDSNGALLSNISAKDIKAIEPDAIFTKLYKTCTQYVAATRAQELNIKFPMIYCHQDATVEDVIVRLAFLKIHRIYVVDEDRKPINVISLGDILTVLLR
jgi:CBS domain-containing protein